MKTSNEMKESLTPLMKQYEQLKSNHRGEILFFRLGDFYEMFGEDAKTAAPILEVALTQRQGVPMCGIPFHSADRYIPKLLKRGLRVAIAEQMEEPLAAKGIVKREIARIISSGTIIEENLLKEKSNNFLAAIAMEPGHPAGPIIPINQKVSLAALDISTGLFTLTEFQIGKNGSDLLNELCRITPAEILLLEDQQQLKTFLGETAVQLVKKTDIASSDLKELYPQLSAHPLAMESAQMIHFYVKKMNSVFLQNIQPPKFLVRSETMSLDRETIENLEIVRNNFEGTAQNSLLGFLDKTLTSMGGRLLKQWLLRPLIHLDKINERLAVVEFFLQETAKRNLCRETLKGISDFERMIVRLSSGRANPRDLIGLKISLSKAHDLGKMLAPSKSAAGPPALFASSYPKTVQEICAELGEWPELTEFINNAIVDEPPIQLENGNVIRPGFDAALDEKRKASLEGKLWLQSLEKREKENRKIPTLKIGYTSVFGYYFEVTKPHIPKVPPSWHRKQTLINAERFVNEELKELEQKIMGAEEQCSRIEKEIFRKIVGRVQESSARIQKTAGATAELDCYLALAEVAEGQSLCKPTVLDSNDLLIAEGWHPVVKESLPPGLFVPNDIHLNGGDRIIILTGPNMSGKSTYLRQVAIIVLMAQIGSFVPAKEARIGLVDRIFTRIGSGDRLAQGKSTFMVEMQETAQIFSYATTRSLIILDEVGRGTSTYDGISIAWAVIEHLAQEIKPKVIFATHFFELTHLAGEIPGVKNYNVQAKEWKDSVVFLHKISPGPADRSYGIHVAQLAGLPQEVIQKAKKILGQLERDHLSLLKTKENIQRELF